MFESHPIPQQISSYQFRLVGDMTLKQFFQVGGGALVALLIYSTNILPIFKWPLIFLSFGLGAAMAFLPFEERPLGKWILSFFGAIYSPTIYYWARQVQGVDFFQKDTQATITDRIIAPQGEEALNRYLTTLPQNTESSTQKLEKEESGFIGKIGDIFLSLSGTTPAPTVQPQPVIQTVTSIAPPKEVQSTSFRPKIVVEETLSELKVPAQKKVTLSGKVPTFSDQAAPPSTPSVPNTLFGQVLDTDDKVVDGAILEIKDIAGRPVRALRSNKVGHFMVVTALQNGDYTITTDKEGLKFDPLTVTTKGEIIEPILIKAKEKHEVEKPFTGEPLIIN